MPRSRTKRIQKLEEVYNSAVKAGVLGRADNPELIEDQESNVIRVSDNTFLKNKAQRLNRQDMPKEEVSQKIRDTKEKLSSLDARDIAPNAANVTNVTNVFNIFNPSASEILEKVNPDLLSRLVNDSGDSGDSGDTESEFIKVVNPDLLSQLVNDSGDSRDSRDSETEFTKVVNPDLVKEIKDSKEDSKKQDQDNKSSIRTVQDTDERVKVQVNPRDPEYEPIKLNVEEDESSIHKIAENNEKIYERLLDMGEVQMANHVHALMGRVEVGPKYKYVSEITENTKAIRQVSDTNTEIEEHLNELRYQFRERQDTEIESVEDVLVQEHLAEQIQEEFVSKDEDSGFWESILSMMIGKPLSLLLLGSRSLLRFATNLLRPALGWLLKALTGGITGLFGSLMRKPLEAFNALRSRFTNFLDVTFKTFRAGYETFKVSVSTKLQNVLNYTRNMISKLSTQVTKMGNSIKNVLKKIPGLSKLAGLIGIGDETSKLSRASSAVSTGFQNIKNSSFVGKLIDVTKTAASKVSSGAKTVYAAGKAGAVASVDWTKGKFKTLADGIAKVSKRVGARFNPVAKKLTEHVSRTGGVVAKPGLFKGMGKFSKVLRAVPFLGQALAVGFAAKGAWDGWSNAGSLYGVPQEDVSIGAKSASALGSMVKELLWPIPISQKGIASAALSLTGGSILKGGTKLQGDYNIGQEGDISQYQESVDFGPDLLMFDTIDTPFKNIAGFESIYGDEYTDILRHGAPIQSGSIPEYSGSMDVETFQGFDDVEAPVNVDSSFTGDSLIGSVSAKYESAGRGVHTISTGQGDPGGVSYGAYQLASKTGTMATFLNSSEGRQFRGMFKGTSPGSKAFSSIYADIAKKYPNEFNKAQHLFIKRTHYDPVANIAAGLGIPVNNRAIQEALWSQSVQHGREGNKKILKGALQNSDPNDIPRFLRALYTSRGNYVSGLSMNSGTKTSVLNRYNSELRDVLGIHGSGIPVNMDNTLGDFDSYDLDSMTIDDTTFGNPYDANTSDYTPEEQISNTLNELGLNVDSIIKEYSKPKDQKLSPELDIPVNDKVKSQTQIEETIQETQEIFNSENLEIMNYINEALGQVHEQISQISVSTEVNANSTNTDDVFSINNTEYIPGEELRF